GGISMEMEKYLSQLPEGEKAKANKVLEINPEHAIFKVLQKIHDKDAEDFSKYTDILYQQALLIEGFPVDDPVDLANKICDLISKVNE
ncbi:MAG: molecular chaperone HtpG, partial [Erysipelotrichaceae bacterium]|nr:molecular chaperone HtpG [Erysipelotrichaceae bacterium]